MVPAPPVPRRLRIRRAAAAAAAVAAAASLAVAPVRAADPPCDGVGRPRGVPPAPLAAPSAAEARRLIGVSHAAFDAARRSPRRDPRFDWTTDGCSRTPPRWAALFLPACRQHDFGYRNLGNGLRLSRDEATRRAVDGRFLTEMRRICDDAYRDWPHEPARRSCRARAVAMHDAVRTFNDWSE